MQIREIHIDGFGIFSNTHITGMIQGINVIYGPNEFGKTTLLAFIRRVLFGFPSLRSPSVNPYPALSGGAYGGKLICELNNNKIIVIHRTKGTHGGSVTIQMDSRELGGQEELDGLLDHITKTFYENVYAISLAELQKVESLDAEEVKSRIYGAGLGLGGISLSDIKNEFSSMSESLYKHRGSAQQMSKLYNEIRLLEQEIRTIKHGLAEYDELLRNRDKLVEEVVNLEEKLRDLQITQRSLENKENLYETYLNLDKAQSDLSQLEELIDFPDDALENLKELKTKLTNIDGQITEKESDITVIKSKRDRCIYNKEIIILEPIVISFQRLSEKYRSAYKDIGKVKSDRRELAEHIEIEIQKLGEGWSEEIIREFELSHLQKDRIRSFKNNIEVNRRKIDSAKDKLELHREGKFAEASKGFTGPEFYRNAIYGVTVVGLIGVIAGLLTSQLWLVGFSSIFLIIGIIVIIKMGKGVKFEKEDPLEKKLSKRVNEVELEQKKLYKKWREFLSSNNFDKDLSPDGVLEVTKAIEDIQSKLTLVEELNSRIKRMQNTIDEAKELQDKVAPSIDESKLSIDVNANLDIFAHELNEARDTKKMGEGFKEQIGELAIRIKTLKEHKNVKEKEIQDYISSLGAKDEEEVKQKHNVFIEQNMLNDKINESKKIIQKTVGTGESYEEFLKSISSTSPPDIERELDEVGRQIEELKELRDEKNQKIGELRNKIENLSSNQDLLIGQSECELKKQKLQDYSREWVKWQIALVMLNKAISKYEQTRQPEVIKAASDIFSHLTNDRYQTMIKPAETNELRIKDEYGNTKGLIEMSRGTKEELYFAMRLGLIKEYEIRAESMPVIMDDILVNFDDDRGPLAIQTLEEFAKGRQIIVLTCHKDTLATYKEYGVKEILVT